MSFDKFTTTCINRSSGVRRKFLTEGQSIGVVRGDKEAMPPKYLENIVILCFERRFSKQNLFA